jgi:hypothetical protein
VTLNNAVQNNFTVDYITSDITASAGSDYIQTSGSLTFGGLNALTQAITVPIIDDAIIEPTETFNVRLINLVTNGQYITLADSVGQGTIQNNDTPNITCSSDIFIGTDTNVCTALIAVPVQIFNTNWPTAILSWTMTGATFDSGTGQIGSYVFNKDVTTISYLVYDSISTNIDTCSFIVNVTDDQIPSFTSPSDITVYKDANCNYDASITITGNVTDELDNCSSGIEAVFVDDTVVLCQGSQRITRVWKLTDEEGNFITHNQIIDILDTISPSINCPNVDDRYFPEPGDDYYYAVGSEFDAVAIDNCSLDSLTHNLTYSRNSTLAGYPFPIGSTDVVWRAVDDCGNVSE